MTSVSMISSVRPVALETTAEVAEYVERELQAAGVDVRAKEAISTSSVYMEFDCGLAKSCRVGDHSGKGYKYKYEIGAHYKKVESVKFKYQDQWYRRHLYPKTQASQLVTDVLQYRRSVQLKYGESWY